MFFLTMPIFIALITYLFLSSEYRVVMSNEFINSLIFEIVSQFVFLFAKIGIVIFNIFVVITIYLA